MTSALVISILLSALATLITTALLAQIAKPVSHRLGVLDYPRGRKIHTEPVPYLGGAAMFLGLAVGLAFFAWRAPEYILIDRDEFVGVLIGAALACMIGLWDDIRGAGAFPKIVCETAIALFMWNQGLRVERITFPFGGALSLSAETLTAQDRSLWLAYGGQILSLLITVGWYVLLMNAINLIDGLDGLAASISMVAAIVVVCTSLAIYIQPPVTVVIVGALTAAACAGFLTHNWHPASIFMGDSGALLLGFLLASTALLSSTKAPALLTLLVPLLAIGLPIVESIHSFLRRLLTRQNPFQADRRHLHHRLLDLGLSHRRVVTTLLYITIFLGMMSYILAIAPPIVSVLAVVLLGAGFLVLLETITALERNDRSSRTRQPNGPAPGSGADEGH